MSGLPIKKSESINYVSMKDSTIKTKGSYFSRNPLPSVVRPGFEPELPA